MKQVMIVALLAVGVFAFARTLEAADYVYPSSPLVREKLEWFRDQKLCLMMHFGVYSILGITESWLYFRMRDGKDSSEFGKSGLNEGGMRARKSPVQGICKGL